MLTQASPRGAGGLRVGMWPLEVRNIIVGISYRQNVIDKGPTHQRTRLTREHARNTPGKGGEEGEGGRTTVFEVLPLLLPIILFRIINQENIGMPSEVGNELQQKLAKRRQLSDNAGLISSLLAGQKAEQESSSKRSSG